MTLTTSIPVLTQFTVDKITAQKATLGLFSVHYGDQNKIPSTPVVCVEPADLTRVLDGVPRKTLVDIDLYVIAYLSSLQSPQVNRKESDELIEALANLLHADPSMNGQVIHSLVSRVESGYMQKENTVMRASRLTFSMRSRELLPPNA